MGSGFSCGRSSAIDVMPINQSNNDSDFSLKPPIDHDQTTDQHDASINQSIDQSNNQLHDQLNKSKKDWSTAGTKPITEEKEPHEIEQAINQIIKQTINQQICDPLDQSLDYSANLSIDQSINPLSPVSSPPMSRAMSMRTPARYQSNQSNNHSSNQSNNQSINRSNTQSNPQSNNQSVNQSRKVRDVKKTVFNQVLNSQELKRFADHFEVISLSINHSIYQQGDLAGYFYLVRNGEVLLYVDQSNNQSNNQNYPAVKQSTNPTVNPLAKQMNGTSSTPTTPKASNRPPNLTINQSNSQLSLVKGRKASVLPTISPSNKLTSPSNKQITTQPINQINNQPVKRRANSVDQSIQGSLLIKPSINQTNNQTNKPSIKQSIKQVIKAAQSGSPKHAKNATFDQSINQTINQTNSPAIKQTVKSQSSGGSRLFSYQSKTLTQSSTRSNNQSSNQSNSKTGNQYNPLSAANTQQVNMTINQSNNQSNSQTNSNTNNHATLAIKRSGDTFGIEALKTNQSISQSNNQAIKPSSNVRDCSCVARTDCELLRISTTKFYEFVSSLQSSSQSTKQTDTTLPAVNNPSSVDQTIDQSNNQTIEIVDKKQQMLDLIGDAIEKCLSKLSFIQSINESNDGSSAQSVNQSSAQPSQQTINHLSLLASLFDWKILKAGKDLFREGDVYDNQSHPSTNQSSNQSDNQSNKQPDNQTISMAGRGNGLYFLYSGVVGVYMRNESTNQSSNQPTNQSSGPVLSSAESAQSNKQPNDQSKGDLIKQLSSGACFGELGLMIQIPRTATITAVSENVLLLHLKLCNFANFVNLFSNKKNMLFKLFCNFETYNRGYQVNQSNNPTNHAKNKSINQSINQTNNQSNPSQFQSYNETYNVSLSCLLQNEIFFHSFYLFCRKEFSTENLEFFWESRIYRTGVINQSINRLIKQLKDNVEDIAIDRISYQTTTQTLDQAERLEEFTRIVQTYISDNAETQVNLKGNTQKNILTIYHAINPSGHHPNNQSSPQGLHQFSFPLNKQASKLSINQSVNQPKHVVNPSVSLVSPKGRTSHSTNQSTNQLPNHLNKPSLSLSANQSSNHIMSQMNTQTGFGFVTRDVFLEAETEIFNLLSTDSFSRFKQSNMFRDCLEQLNDRARAQSNNHSTRPSLHQLIRQSSDEIAPRSSLSINQTLDHSLNRADSCSDQYNITPSQSPKLSNNQIINQSIKQLISQSEAAFILNDTQASDTPVGQTIKPPSPLLSDRTTNRSSIQMINDSTDQTNNQSIQTKLPQLIDQSACTSVTSSITPPVIDLRKSPSINPSIAQPAIQSNARPVSPSFSLAAVVPVDQLNNQTISRSARSMQNPGSVISPRKTVFQSSSESNNQSNNQSNASSTNSSRPASPAGRPSNNQTLKQSLNQSIPSIKNLVSAKRSSTRFTHKQATPKQSDQIIKQSNNQSINLARATLTRTTSGNSSINQSNNQSNNQSAAGRFTSFHFNQKINRGVQSINQSVNESSPVREATRSIGEPDPLFVIKTKS